MRKCLLAVLLIVLCILMLYKSPLSAAYYYKQAKALYDGGKYEQALPMFEKTLFASKKHLLARFYYVMSLSKAEPTYTVQKKLFKMGNSDIDDEAKNMPDIRQYL